MQNKEVARYTALAGLGVAVAFIASLIIGHVGSLPKTGDSATKIAKFFVEHRKSGEVSDWLGAAAWCGLFLVFATGLWSLLRSAESGALATLGLAGGVAVSAILAVVYGLTFLLHFEVQHHSLGGQGSQIFYDLTVLLANLSGFATAVFLVGFSGVIAKTKVMPVWVAWSGLFIALVHLLGTASFKQSGALSPTGVFAFAAPGLITLWIIAVSVLLLNWREPEPQRA